MGVKEIRTVVKCDFSKPAWEQPGFHVRVTKYDSLKRLSG